LTIVSAGLWGVSWLALAISRRHWPYQCRRCGARISAELAACFRGINDPDPEQKLVEELAADEHVAELLEDPEFDLTTFEFERSNSSA
jgi:hypothetical protein